jgi:hypothetical protein
MDTDCVMCEAKTELLYFSLLYFMLQMAGVFLLCGLLDALMTLLQLQTL